MTLLKRKQTTAFNTIDVNSESDFGTASGGEIELENGKKYLVNQLITISNTLVVPAGASVEIEATSILTHFLIYTGTGTLFKSDGGVGLVLKSVFLIGNSSATLFDLDNGILTSIILGQVFNWGDLGTVRGTYLSFDVDYVNYEAGFKFRTRTDAAEVETNIRFNGSFFDATTASPTTTILDVADTNLFRVIIQNGGATPVSTETVFNFDPTLDDNIRITVTDFDLVSDPLAVFATDSSDQTRVLSDFQSNAGIPNSTAIAKLSYAGNTATTTISSSSTNTIINSNVLYTIDSLIERFLIQDTVTFDNTTNTLTAAFSHAMADDDRVFLNTYTGTLPAELDEDTEYFVISASGADFQLSLTEGGSAVAFTDDGSGTNYFRHDTGVTELAQMIYVGNEDIKCSVGGNIRLSSTTGTKIDVRATIMEIALDGTISELQTGDPVTVNSSEPGSSNLVNVATISQGEGTVIYIRNDSDTTDIVADDYLTTLIKA